MAIRRNSVYYWPLSSIVFGHGSLFGFISLGLLLTSAVPDGASPLVAEKSKVFFVPGKDFEVTWYYNVSRDSRSPKTVEAWAHLSNGSREGLLLWTLRIVEVDAGLDVIMTENREMSSSRFFAVFYGRTQLNQGSEGYVHKYDLLIRRPPLNTSQYEFSCVVQPETFGRTEARIKILRAIKPTIISSLREKISFRKGERVNIQCLAAGVPTPEVIWTRLYDQGPKLQSRGNEKADLIISNIQPESTGTYTCVAKNLGGEIKKEVAVTVSYLEIDATYGRLHRSAIDKPLRIDCPILGYPEPSYSWSRGGRLLKTGKSLSFTRLVKNNFGNYTCQAFNQVGQMGTFVLVENIEAMSATRGGNGSASISFSYKVWLIISTFSFIIIHLRLQ